MVLEKDVDWHLRLIGNKQTALFKFVQTLVRGQRSYTIRLHRDYMVDSTKLTEFQFKAMLGKLIILSVLLIMSQCSIQRVNARIKKKRGEKLLEVV